MKSFFVFFLFLVGCAASKRPVLTYTPQDIGRGGIIARDLYRSFWLPPGRDEDSIRIGIIPERRVIRFQGLSPIRIHALGERVSWSVASPEKVIWEVEFRGTVRPPLIRYFATVHDRLSFEIFPEMERIRTDWISRGFPDARWVGPPPMDNGLSDDTFKRWFLSVTPPTSEEIASRACNAVRKSHRPCYVLGRVDFAPVGEGVLRAVSSNFEKEFEGILEIEPKSKVVRVFDVMKDPITGVSSNEDYDGSLFFVPNLNESLSLVQSTTLGRYLSSVVPSEIFSSAPAEALRAQAVIARTYAIRNVHHRFSTKPFLTCATVQCQVYKGVGMRKPTTTQAVAETRNLVVREASGHLAETFYHAISGGHTESKSVIWGGKDQSYLRGISDVLPGSEFPPLRSDPSVRNYLLSPPGTYAGEATLLKPDRWRWQKDWSLSDIRSFLQKFGLKGELKDIQILRRGISGRALAVLVTTTKNSKKIEGELSIRQAFGGLLSSLFVIDFHYGSQGEIQGLTFLGGAYGHGVGLCQMGAIGRAERDQSFTQILNAYYPGTTVSPITTPVVE